MMIPAEGPATVIEAVIRYRYQGKPWRLIFRMDAPDPVVSIYFDQEEAMVAREAIGARGKRDAPLGEVWEWEEQGVRNEPDESEVTMDSVEQARVAPGREVRQSALRSGSEDDTEQVTHLAYDTGEDNGDLLDSEEDFTACWHHKSCLWSCLN